jgi:hypothetical protein
MCVYVRVWVGGLHHLPRRCAAEHPRDRHGAVLALSVCWCVCRMCSLKIEFKRDTNCTQYVLVCVRAHVCALVPIDPPTPTSLTPRERVRVPYKNVVCVPTDCWVFITHFCVPNRHRLLVFITWDWEESVEWPPFVCVCVCVSVCVCGVFRGIPCAAQCL